MAKTFEFWFDFGSPASYLAWTQIAAIEQETGATAQHRPMLLGGVFQATGNQSPATIPAKGKYTFDDFDRFARRYGVPLTRNPHFPINTLMLMRGAVGLQLREPARFIAYCDAVFRAIWVHVQNLNDPATVGGVLHQAGFDPQALLAMTAGQRGQGHTQGRHAGSHRPGYFRRAHLLRRHPDVLGPGPYRLRQGSIEMTQDILSTPKPV
jgi:2-hydroxychromene-2-carboxylate isomerase